MKQLTFYLLLILFSFDFLSCQMNDSSVNPNGSSTSGNTSQLAKSPRKRLYCAAWSEWGRKSQKCGSWGLCNFSDCWFCSCDQVNMKALVIFDDSLNRFNMTIELTQEDSKEVTAIANRLPLAIDADILSENLIVKAGSYPFDYKVGSFGGYIIPAYER